MENPLQQDNQISPLLLDIQ